MHTERVLDDPAAPDPLLDPPRWAPSWLPTIDDVRRVRVLWWVVGVVFFAGLAACVSRGADAPEDPVLGPAASPTVAPSGGDGGTDLAATFGTVVAELVSASGDVLQLCLLHADTAEERARGLMQVRDLQGHAGMAFSTEQPGENPFYMYDTVLPLTIAWWDSDGEFVSATDMAPCPSADSSQCPRYRSSGPYQLALEVEQGSPVARHFGPGASLRLTGAACTASA